MFSRRTASHVICVASVHDLLMGIEMTWPRIHRIDLTDIGRAVWYARHGGIAGNEEKVNAFLWEAYERSVLYDVPGLFEFLGLGDDADRKLYCSELAREMYHAAGIRTFPRPWREMVSPLDLQRYHEGRGELCYLE